MNRRDTVLALLEPGTPQTRVPAAFFLHFDPEHHFGRPAVERHLEFFRATGMDFVKIQYERRFPPLPDVRSAADWRSIASYDEEFFRPQLDAVEGIVREAGGDALVIVTLYSPFMCAGHAIGDDAVLRHIREDPAAVTAGMEAFTESLLTFVRACVRLGVDGFYHSTQGGEVGRLSNEALFDRFVRPYDLAVMREADRSCAFNVLHLCDYVGEYPDLGRFRDYPGHVVSCPLNVGGRPLSLAAAREMFGRPVMGGLDRLGVIAAGSEAQIRAATEAVLRTAPDRFILGADCTVPAETPWANLRVAIDTAHAWRSR